MRKTLILSIAACFAFAGAIANETEVSLNTPNSVTLESSSVYELSSFCKAVIRGDIETVKKLIDLGEDVNQKSLGKTPVHFAARYNRVEVLELLLANGANVRTLCDKGRSAMDYAKLSGATEVMDVIESAMIQ
ncbi:MAG: ankyrin repeat domain-containing protein [Bacteroidota bacterium]